MAWGRRWRGVGAAEASFARRGSSRGHGRTFIEKIADPVRVAIRKCTGGPGGSLDALLAECDCCTGRKRARGDPGHGWPCQGVPALAGLRAANTTLLASLPHLVVLPVLPAIRRLARTASLGRSGDGSRMRTRSAFSVRKSCPFSRAKHRVSLCSAVVVTYCFAGGWF